MEPQNKLLIAEFAQIIGFCRLSGQILLFLNNITREATICCNQPFISILLEFGSSLCSVIIE